MKLPWSSSQKQSEKEQTTQADKKQTTQITKDMPDSKKAEPILNFEGKKYDLQSLPDDLKELLRRLQVAEQQLRMHDDTLKVLAVGRQTIASQIKEKLTKITPLPDQK